MKTTFEKARRFIYRNARPIELARWQYHFEGGSQENVLHALRFYQNEDGGFGHGLEADSLNPESSPITTWNAAVILEEIGWKDASHPIVTGILRYLDSGVHFDEAHQQWLNCIPSNNDHPHAIWWSYDGNDAFQYNPTAALAGFILRYAAADTPLYHKACQIAKAAVAWFEAQEPLGEQHVTGCMVLLYRQMKAANLQLVDMDALAQRLKAQVSHCICKETERWYHEYVCKPVNFSITPDSEFYAGNGELARFQCQFIRETQLQDGSFVVPWTWYNDYKEFELSANWWRSVIILENMLYLRGFGLV